MPKKARALKSDESVVSALTNEEGGQYTGLLKHDLPLSCVEHGVPNIMIRTLDGLPVAATGQEDAGGTDVVGPQCVWVRTDGKEPSGRKLLLLTIRGWLVTPPALQALITALKSSLVHTLQFWNTGLDMSTLPLVVELASQVQCSWLSVEGTVLTDLSPLLPLLTNAKSLRILQLRSCALADGSLDPLVDTLTSNTSLQQLDLCHNRLSDQTCSQVALVLRLNRSLLSLSLTNNNISHVGVAHIASVLQEFILTHNEIVKRRRMLSSRHDAEWSRIWTLSTTSRRSSSKLSRSKNTDKSKKGDGGKKEPSARAVIASASFIARAKRSAENSRKKAAAKDKHHTTDESTTAATHDSRPSSTNLPLSVCGPLVEDVVERDGKVFAAGNRTLINLGLSYNKVGVAGCDLLLSVVRSQREWVESHSDGVSREGDAASSTGLKRLSLHHNMFDDDLDQYQQLLVLLPTLTLTTSTINTPSQ